MSPTRPDQDREGPPDREPDAGVVDRVVDTGRYPLTAPGSAAWRRAVADARSRLRETGCCVLAGFVRTELAETLRRECAALAASAYYGREVVNVYNTAPDTACAPDHPGRATVERGNAFVARDAIPAEAIVHRLYVNRLFQEFVACCFELPRLHELADPLAGLCVNVVRPGNGHPWHFDTNEFAVSMLTQQPRRGGRFEYCKDIRTPEDENLAAVREVLDGRGGARTRGLALQPGDLQLFRGRYSLHRVTAVQGERDRHSVVFAYSERPGVVGSVTRTRQLFGRVTPVHLTAADRAVRGDRLLD